MTDLRFHHLIYPLDDILRAHRLDLVLAVTQFAQHGIIVLAKPRRRRSHLRAAVREFERHHRYREIAAVSRRVLVCMQQVARRELRIFHRFRNFSGARGWHVAALQKILPLLRGFGGDDVFNDLRLFCIVLVAFLV